MANVCIHRGAKQIGGTCIELEQDGARLILDLGLPLDADEATPDLLPAVDEDSRNRTPACWASC